MGQKIQQNIKRRAILLSFDDILGDSEWIFQSEQDSHNTKHFVFAQNLDVLFYPALSPDSTSTAKFFIILTRKVYKN